MSINEDDEVAAESVHDQNEIKNASCWSVDDSGGYFPCSSSSKVLPAGQYTVEVKNGQFYLSHNPVNIDDLLELPDSSVEEVVHNIEKFWEKEGDFRNHGFLWKRGILLYGPPGGGKTCAVQTISKKIVERDGITLYVQDPNMAEYGLKMLRKIEPVRELVVIMEDIDSIIEEYGESSILSLLDGELQIDNVVFLATTNYPENLDRRIRNRPSRFDMVKRIEMPTREARKMFLDAKGLDKETIELWLDHTDGFSIAHLKEMIVSIIIMGNSFEDTIERLNEMMEYAPTSEDDTGKRRPIGFTTPQPKRRAFRKTDL